MNSRGASWDDLAPTSPETEFYRDQITRLNTDAMGDRSEWDTHGQRTFDLVMCMAARIDELNAERGGTAFLDEALNSGDGTYKP